MNNIYEHTTQARNSRNGWTRTRELGTLGSRMEFWDWDNLGYFTNILEDKNPRLFFLFGFDAHALIASLRKHHTWLFCCSVGIGFFFFFLYIEHNAIKSHCVQIFYTSVGFVL
jgi:hypothetical protein